MGRRALIGTPLAFGECTELPVKWKKRRMNQVKIQSGQGCADPTQG